MASEALAALIAAKRADPYSPDKTIEALRRESEVSGRGIPLPPGTRLEPVSAGGVPSEWISPASMVGDSVFLFIFGGGYYRGSVASTRAPAAHVALACRARCLSIGYRLAPEHPFPAALSDALAAYRWLLVEGACANQIVVGGISAGGGLTLALLLALRDAGEPLPCATVPMSPWTDLTQSGASYRTKADADPSISKAYLDRMAAYYLAGADPKSPLASPLHGDLQGLPPCLIQVGSAETMLDDSVAFAAKAEAAGVEVHMEIWEDMIHGWHQSPHVLPEAREAIDRIGEFFRQRVG